MQQYASVGRHAANTVTLTTTACAATGLLLQIDAVLQRLAGASGLRQTVPGFMASALEQQLKELRPPEDTAGGDAADTAVQ